MTIGFFNIYVLFYKKKIDIAKSKKYSFLKFQLYVAEQILQNIYIHNY